MSINIDKLRAKYEKGLKFANTRIEIYHKHKDISGAELASNCAQYYRGALGALNDLEEAGE